MGYCYPSAVLYMIFVYYLLSLLALSLFASVGGTLLRVVFQERSFRGWSQWSAECTEVCAFFLNLLTYPWGWLPSRPHQQPGEGLPVILVHGYAVNRLSLSVISWYLRRKGYPWVWSINHPVLKDDLMAFAESLDKKIRWYCHYTQHKEVLVVTHSMGGIVSMLAHTKFQTPIAKLVSLGTPWKGTQMQALGLGKHVKQMSPTHMIMRNLENPPFPHLAIWSKMDWIVLPTENAIKEELNHYAVDQVGHFGMLINHHCIQKIHQFLGNHEPTNPIRDR